jgi:hypothetical protein
MVGQTFDEREPVMLTVVVASIESSRSLRQSLESIRKSVEGIETEIVVVDASRDGSAEIARSLGVAKVVKRRPGTLAPELWADGIRASRGRIVALTTGHCVVGPQWARSLIAALDSGLQGAAGGLQLGDETSVTDWAVFYLRYSEFMRESIGDRAPVPMIPADNAAYRGNEIRAYMADREGGFWEVDYHRALQRDSGALGFVSAATASFARSFPLATIAAHRFAHGRHFGAWRVAGGTVSRTRAILATPLVPLVLVARAIRRVWPHPAHRGRFALSAPAFLFLASAWAAGEVYGAVVGPRVAARGLQEAA